MSYPLSIGRLVLKWSCLLFFWCVVASAANAQSIPPDLEALMDHGKMLYQDRHYPEAAAAFEQFLESARAQDDERVLGACYYVLGKYYQEQQLHQRSLALLLASTQLLEPRFATLRSNIIAPPLDESPATFNLSMPEDAAIICEVYNKVGSLYFQQNNYAKARHYWSKAYRIAALHQSAKALSTAYNNLGELERMKGHLDTALLYYQKASRIKTHIRDSVGLLVNWTNIAKVYLERHQPALAHPYFERAHRLALQLQQAPAIVHTSLDYGQYYLYTQQLDSAAHWLQTGLRQADALALLSAQTQAHQALADLYERMGNLPTSLYHQKKWTALRQALLQSSRQKLTMQTEAEYLMHEKEKQILQMRQKAALERAENQRLDLLQWGGLLFMAILLLVAGYVLYLHRRHQTELTHHCQRIEQQNTEKDVLLREIHHRVKNNLQVITSLLGLQSLAIDDPAVKDLFLQSQRRINSMSMIHQMLYQSDQLANINYRNYLARLIDALVRSQKGDQAELQIVLDVPELSLNIDTAIPLGLLVNEIVTNALKYGLHNGSESVLSVQLQQLEDGTFRLRIGDNGDGIPGDWKAASSRMSLGLRLVQQLARQLQGTIQRDPHQKGMHYVLNFKEIHSRT